MEDDPEVRALAHEVLEAQGYTVLGAANGGEALGIAERDAGRLDPLATDVVLPHMGGWDLSERLAPARPDMKVLFIAGYAPDPAFPQAVLDAGRSLLAKPFTPEALSHRVRDMLDSRANTSP